MSVQTWEGHENFIKEGYPKTPTQVVEKVFKDNDVPFVDGCLLTAMWLQVNT